MISSSDVCSILQGDREAAMKKLPFAFELYRQFVAAKTASERTLPVDSFRKRFEWGEIECSIVHGRAKLIVTTYPEPHEPPAINPDIEIEREGEELFVRERVCLKIFAHVSRLTKTVWPFNAMGYDFSPGDFSSGFAICAIDLETLELLAIGSIPTGMLPLVSRWSSEEWDDVPMIVDVAPYRTEFGPVYNTMISLTIPGVDNLADDAKLVERTSVAITPAVSPTDRHKWDANTGLALFGAALIDTGANGILPNEYRNTECNHYVQSTNEYLCHLIYDEAQCDGDTYYRFTFYDTGPWYNQYQATSPPTVRCHTVGEHEFYFAYGDGVLHRVQGIRFPFGGMHFSGMIAWTDTKYNRVEPLPMNITGNTTALFYETGSGFSGMYEDSTRWPFTNFQVGGYSFFMNQLMGNYVEIDPDSEVNHTTMQGALLVVSAFAGMQPTVPIDEITENTTIVDHIKAVVEAAVVVSGGEVRTLAALPPEIAQNPNAYYWASAGITEFDVKTRRGTMHLSPMAGMNIGAVLTKERAVYKRAKPTTSETTPSTEAQNHGA